MIKSGMNPPGPSRFKSFPGSKTGRAGWESALWRCSPNRGSGGGGRDAHLPTAASARSAMDILGSGVIAERIAKEKGLALVRAGVRVAEAEGRGVGEIAGEAARAHNLATVDGVSTASKGLHLTSGFEGHRRFVVRIAQAKRGEAGEEAEELSPTCG
jgi:hypothetical protein